VEKQPTLTDRDAANRPGNEPVQSADVSTASLLSWGLYDWANSSFSSVILTFVFAAYFTRQVAENQTIGTTEWGTVIGIVGIVVAMGGPVLGSLVDQHGPRKPWIILFTLLCVTATALLWFVKPSTAYVEMGLLLVALANLASEFGNIFYNAMLPQLVSANRLGRWSGWGWALGYAGGLSCLVLSLLAFVRSHNPWIELDRHSAQDVRATFVFVAAWYLSF
jgi:UMF1 family MFS transporter